MQCRLGRRMGESRGSDDLEGSGRVKGTLEEPESLECGHDESELSLDSMGFGCRPLIQYSSDFWVVMRIQVGNVYCLRINSSESNK